MVLVLRGRDFYLLITGELPLGRNRIIEVKTRWKLLVMSVLL